MRSLRAHVAVVVIDDAVAVEEGRGPFDGRAGHFVHHGLLDLVADAMRDGEMDLLDDRRVVAGRDQEMIAGRCHCRALGAGEADGDQAVLARGSQRGEDVRRAAGGRQRQQHVAAAAEALDLAGEHLLEAVVVGDRGQRRGVGRQARSRHRPAVRACSGRRSRRRCAARRPRCRHCRRAGACCRRAGRIDDHLRDFSRSRRASRHPAPRARTPRARF